VTASTDPKPWFVKRTPAQGYGYGIGSWQGAAVLLAYTLMISVPPIGLVLATGSLLAFFLWAVACCLGGTWWLVRMIRAHGDPDA
jgi:hypothetical protein